MQKALRPRSPPDEPAPEGRSSVFQPVRLLAGLAVLVLGPAGISTVLAAGLVLSRSARTLQNAIGYPLWVRDEEVARAVEPRRTPGTASSSARVGFPAG